MIDIVATNTDSVMVGGFLISRDEIRDLLEGVNSDIFKAQNLDEKEELEGVRNWLESKLT